MTTQTRGHHTRFSDTVTDNIRAEAARRRISQQQLGEAIGVGRMAISERYRGRRHWSLDEVAIVAALFGMPLGELLGLPRLDSNQQPADYPSSVLPDLSRHRTCTECGGPMAWSTVLACWVCDFCGICDPAALAWELAA